MVSRFAGKLPQDVANRIVKGCLFLTLAGSLYFLLKVCRYGFDFTDEGYYLSSILNHKNYLYTVTQFGFVYAPLYELVDGDLTLFRQINVMATFAFSWFLAYAALYRILPPLHMSIPQRLGLAGAVAMGSAYFYRLWLPTPNYNSLNLQALLIALLGLMLTTSNKTRSVGWIVTGIGFWFIAMAKPTTAVAAAFAAAGFWVFQKNKTWHVLFAPIALLLGLFLSAIAIDGSVISFVKRLSTGASLTSRFDSAYSVESILRLGEFPKNFSEWGAIFVVYVFSTTMLWLAYSKKAVPKALWTGILIFLCTIPFRNRFPGFEELPEKSKTFLFLAFFSAALTFRFFNKKGHTDRFRLPKIAILSLLLPYCFAFGTDSDYWFIGSLAAVFWALACILVLEGIEPDVRLERVTLTIGVFILITSVALAKVSVLSPYRQPQSLLTQSSWTELRSASSRIMLDYEYSRFISEVRESLTRHGFQTDDPVMDLSGRFPGLVYAVGGLSLGQPWFIGGRSGSSEIVKFYVDKIDKTQLSRTWLFAEPGGEYAISSHVMSDIESKIGSNIKKIAEIRIPDFLIVRSSLSHSKFLEIWLPETTLLASPK